MNYNSIIDKADRHHSRMLKVLEPLNKKLIKLLGDDDIVDVFMQTDGWCIVFGYAANNTPVNRVDFEKLFKMTREDATAYLEKLSI